MEIRIDISKENKEDIRKIIRFLQSLVEEDAHAAVDNADIPAMDIFQEEQPKKQEGFKPIFY